MSVIASAMQFTELTKSDCTSDERVVAVLSLQSNDGGVGGSNGLLVNRNKKSPCLPGARFQ